MDIETRFYFDILMSKKLPTNIAITWIDLKLPLTNGIQIDSFALFNCVRSATVTTPNQLKCFKNVMSCDVM